MRLLRLTADRVRNARGPVTTTIELVGFVQLAAAAYTVSTAAGLAVSGALTVAAGWLLDAPVATGEVEE